MEKSTNTIAITGGTKGMGRAIAEFFAERSWQVVVSARGEDSLASMRSFWATHFPASSLVTCAADLSTREGCAAFVEAIQQNAPRLQLLINNVGIFAAGNLRDQPTNILEQFLQLNVLAAHRITTPLLDLLSAAERSHIITIGSVATSDWPAGNNIYSISKYALQGWQKALQQELSGTSTRVSMITPGATQTSSWDGEDIPPGLSLLDPVVIAETVAHLWDTNTSSSVEEIILRPR